MFTLITMTDDFDIFIVVCLLFIGCECFMLLLLLRYSALCFRVLVRIYTVDYCTTILYRKFSLLMNWTELGHFGISGVKKTNFLRILEGTRYLACH